MENSNEHEAQPHETEARSYAHAQTIPVLPHPPTTIHRKPVGAHAAASVVAPPSKYPSSFEKETKPESQVQSLRSLHPTTTTSTSSTYPPDTKAHEAGRYYNNTNTKPYTNNPLPPVPANEDQNQHHQHHHYHHKRSYFQTLKNKYRNLPRRKRRLVQILTPILLIVLLLIIILPVVLTRRKGSQFSNLPLPTNHGGPYTGDLTYYDPALGSCGVTSTGEDFIVAVSHLVYDAVSTGSNPNNNPLCGRKIRASRGGKSVDLTVVDRCTGCKAKDLDVTRTVFQGLADLDLGRTTVTWAWLEDVPGSASGL